MRYNDKLYDISKNTPIVNVVKMNRLRWAGHVWRMPNNMPAKIALDSQPYNDQKRRGRPKTR
jgi:hypothetical protein